MRFFIYLNDSHSRSEINEMVSSYYDSIESSTDISEESIVDNFMKYVRERFTDIKCKRNEKDQSLLEFGNYFIKLKLNNYKINRKNKNEV